MLWSDIFDKIKKPLIVLIAIITAFCGGYLYSGSKKPEVVVQEKVVEKIVEVEKKQTDTIKVTKITKRPDGSSDEIVEERTRSVVDKMVSSDKQKDTTSSPVKNPTKFKIGIYALLSEPSDITEIKQNYGVFVGARIKQTSFWINGFYNNKNKEIGIGPSIEF